MYFENVKQIRLSTILLLNIYEIFSYNFKKLGLRWGGGLFFISPQIFIISIDGLFALIFLLSLWGLNTSKYQNWKNLINFLDFVLKILRIIIRDTSEL